MKKKKTEVTIFSTYKAIQKPQFIDASFVWPFSLLIVLASFGDLICTERPSCLMHIYCAKLETGFTRIQTVKCHSPLLHYITNFPTEGRFVCHSDSFAKAKKWVLLTRFPMVSANQEHYSTGQYECFTWSEVGCYIFRQKDDLFANLFLFPALKTISIRH